jgi:SAM-dependent methyltransferase
MAPLEGSEQGNQCVPLITPVELARLLRCPACRAELCSTSEAAEFECTNTFCKLADKPFPTSRGLPALVDFDESVLREADLSKETGVIRRSKQVGWRTSVRRLLLPYNEMAARNAHTFLAELRNCDEAPLVLVVGGGAVGSGAQALYSEPGVRLVGFDIYGSENVQLIADGHQMPFANQSFDGVWIQAVLEHVLDPKRVVDEIGRVLRSGGIVYAETPFMQGVHEGAYDFTRFTDSGHRWLFRRFDLIDSGAVLGPFAQLLWSINQSTRALFRSSKAGVAAQLLFFWLKYLDRFVREDFARDSASALFFLGRKGEGTMSPSDIVAYYRGGQRR